MLATTCASKLLAMRRRAAALQHLGKLLQLAVLERRHHGLVHIALAADRRRVGKFFRHRRHGVLHLPPPAALARCGLDMRERFERSRRRAQRAEILQRNLHARDLAQKRVHVARGDDAG